MGGTAAAAAAAAAVDEAERHESDDRETNPFLAVRVTVDRATPALWSDNKMLQAFMVSFCSVAYGVVGKGLSM